MTLEILTSDALLPVRHGFFTRRGGASAGIFKGLNCGQGSSDQSDIVALNRRQVARAMQVLPDRLLSLHQVHSARALAVTGPWPGDRPQADAMVCRTPGVALGILTADCAPILFADPKGGVIGAAHAGWKGALGGVVAGTIAAMLDLGAKRTQIHATIGPCISQRAYEVGPDFLDMFVNDDPEHSRFFAQGKHDRYQFDLPSFCLHRLRAEGIASADWSGHCTYSDADRFFSYRRTTHAGEADYGRLISAITL
jgi:purine-nucleoside/S-methyl-5'-thioadenosine phosphorylase / adenosine deaminase